MATGRNPIAAYICFGVPSGSQTMTTGPVVTNEAAAVSIELFVAKRQKGLVDIESAAYEIVHGGMVADAQALRLLTARATLRGDDEDHQTYGRPREREVCGSRL